MPLIKIRQRILPAIGVLHWTAAKFIFDRKNFNAEDKVILEEGIEGWSKKIDISPVDKWEIKRIINALCADENGHFNRAKELIRQWNITYQKLYKMGLPFINNPDKCRTFGKG